MTSARSTLRTTLFILATTLVLAPAAAQSARTVSRTFDLNADGAVQLDTFTGSIDVTSWDRSTVEVEARIEGEKDLVNKTGIDFGASSNRLDIDVDYDKVKDSQQFLGLFSIGDVDRPEVHFTIRMPRTADLSVDDFSSEISVRGLQAGVNIETFSSPIRLEDIDGRIDLETFSGEIEGTNLRGSIRVETFSGNAQLGLAELSGDSHFETFSGNVELTLPTEAEFELVADEDTFGDLQSEFALTAEGSRRVAGDGGPRIEIETFSGNLRLRKQS